MLRPSPPRRCRWGGMLSSPLCLGLLLALLALLAAPSHAAQLHFHMQAGWDTTPLGLEASEFFTDASQYFDFIEKYNQQLSSSSSYPTEQAQYDTSLSIASSLLGAGSTSLSVLRASLQLRSASPAVETLRHMRVNRVARQVADIPYDHEGAQELKEASEREWMECGALVALNGRLTCGTEGIQWRAEEDDEPEPVHSFDHVHPASASPGPGVTTVVLYADPARPEFAKAHAAILARMFTHPLRYVLRPSLSASPSSSSAAAATSSAPASALLVHGFGVELALKNMEYKVLDDASGQVEVAGAGADEGNHAALPPQEGESDDQQQQQEQQTEVAGMKFDVLKERRPELADELEQLRLQLLRDEAEGVSPDSASSSSSSSAASDSEKKPAVWELKDLGYQASQRILLARDPLDALQTLSQDFPMYAHALTRVKVNHTIKHALERNAARPDVTGGRLQGLPAPGSNVLDINGIGIELGQGGDELDYFSLLSLLKSEAEVLDELADSALTPSSIGRVLRDLHMRSLAESEASVAYAQGGQGGHDASVGPFLLHMGLDSPSTHRIATFLNDLERDPRYRSWPPSVQEYLVPSWPNQLKYVRRNMYTGVALADWAHSKGLDFATQAMFFVEKNAPIRIALVPYVPMAAEYARAMQDGEGGSDSAAAAATPRSAWNSDVLSRAEGTPWAALASEDDDDAVVSSSPHDAAFASPQALVAKVYFFLLHYSSESRAPKAQQNALEFLSALHALNPTRTEPVTREEVEGVYTRVAKRVGLKGVPSFSKLMDMDELNELVQLCAEYASSRGIRYDHARAAPSSSSSPSAVPPTPGQMPLLVVNGVLHRSASHRSFRDVMMGAIMPEQHRMMMRVYHGDITDRVEDIHAYLQAKSNVLTRMNHKIATTVADMNIISSLPPLASTPSTVPLAYFPSRPHDADADSDPSATGGVSTLSYWLFADLSTARGLGFLDAALDFLARGRGGEGVRLALVQNPSIDASTASTGGGVSLQPSQRVGKMVSALLYSSPSLSLSQRFDFLRQLVMLARYFLHDPSRLQTALETFVRSNAPQLDHLAPLLTAAIHPASTMAQDLNPALPAGFLPSLAASAAAGSGILPGQVALLLNGRLIRLEDRAIFSPESFVSDLTLLSEFTRSNFPALGQLARMLRPKGERALQFVDNGSATSSSTDASFLSDVLMRVSFVLLKRQLTLSTFSYARGGGGIVRSDSTVVASFPPAEGPGVIRLPPDSGSDASASRSSHDDDGSPDDGALLSLRLIVDPLSKTAQKLSPILRALRTHFRTHLGMTIWLSPRAGVTEFPLKRFYRYALPTAGEDLRFDASTGALQSSSGASFLSLRTRHILSTVLHTPESWGIKLTGARFDLDNLDVASMPDSTTETVRYQLETLLLFGQCVDRSKMEPPAGLQLMLGAPGSDWVSDTVVMQNLGYFQLKAPAPGEWTVRIAEERHGEIYEMQPEEQEEGGEDGAVTPSSSGVQRGTRQFFIRSFHERNVRLDVLRRPGQEGAQLLDPSSVLGQRRRRQQAEKKRMMKAAATDAEEKKKDQGGAAGAMGAMWKSVFGSSDPAPAPAAPTPTADASVTSTSASSPSSAVSIDPILLPRSGETIHVFSLASGHLYERFLKIMMLSVLRSTRNPVKFWFLANFASPQLREFVPRMAKHLNFEAEFVTYKWPSWLRRQEEKQRIIWGYKILFLDVLFPLAVHRILYIDADQVVRGDLLELWNRDLAGAPYAYTPFCDSNTETEGFRFWKSGYWKDHLRGKPYHISALYIVDLDVFRALRAGDTLRGVYDQLSADPGSLANLDQDLPNYAQHMVPIHSLPQEWLWCQTWCSMDSLPEAKTVDLCNNPLTKTPKLEVAKSLLPEWVELDAKAKAMEPLFAAQQEKQAAQRAQRAEATHGSPALERSTHDHEDL